MAILGKDLVNYSNNFFEFTALFAADGIEIFEKSYNYSEILTGFLNYDSTEYLKLTDALTISFNKQEEKSYLDVCYKINEIIPHMPLFCDLTNRFDLLNWDYFNPFLEEKPTENPYRLYNNYLKLAEDLRIIKERYSCFIREIFYKTFPKVKTNKYAYQVENNGMSAFVSGVSLGRSSGVDPAVTSVQYEIRESQVSGEAQLFEKMIFKNLIDFIYVDLFKGMMLENIPKLCKLCGRYFLQEKGHLYEYCENLAPNEARKTCREIGSLASFRDKVKNNEIWQIHQRAYKKYYARVLKEKMTKEEFAIWATQAENLRDETLRKETFEKKQGREFPLDGYIFELNKV